MMRIALTGVSHWHLPLYLDPVLALPGMPVVGVADPDPAVAGRVGRQAGCPSWTDHRAMLDAAAPDFVFVLGRHCDMAGVCRDLIDRGIGFAVEKPAGLDVAEVTELAGRARAAGAFAAVPFVFRHSRLLEVLRSVDEPVVSMAFKFVAGSVDRYRETGNEWMLHRETSGGGCLLNLGVHFLDLARLLLGPDVEVAASMMTSLLDDVDTEDHAMVALRTARGDCLIETGYLYPAPHLAFDMHFSIRTTHHHFAATDDKGVHILTPDGRHRYEPMPMANPPYYEVFVQDVLARVAEGRPPLADLTELAASMRLLDAAYTLGRQGDSAGAGKSQGRP